MNRSSVPLLDVQNLRKYFAVRSGVFSRPTAWVHAVHDISFQIGAGEVVGLVGESGSGKTTVARLLVRLLQPTSGRILFEGVDISAMPDKEFRPFRRRIQMVFQDPFASLNPRMTVGNAIAEALSIHSLPTGDSGSDRVVQLLEQVGLTGDHATRYPHEFSGGQRQRVGIARALAVDPVLLVADEPVSALDVSVQAQVVNLLQDLQQERALSMLFVAHDLSIVEHVSDRVIVMYLGNVVEVGTASSIMTNPQHPYTQGLIDAAPVADPSFVRHRSSSRSVLGEPPSPINPPSGCVFRTRCPIATKECAEVVPALKSTGGDSGGHLVACIKK